MMTLASQLRSLPLWSRQSRIVALSQQLASTQSEITSTQTELTQITTRLSYLHSQTDSIQLRESVLQANIQLRKEKALLDTYRVRQRRRGEA